MAKYKPPMKIDAIDAAGQRAMRELSELEGLARSRLEADALASVALDAGDTRVEPDYKAAVRDLAAALKDSSRSSPWWKREVEGLMEKHAPAIAAARSET